MANANLVLLDSLVAERSNGSLIVGRGVPASWIAPGPSRLRYGTPSTPNQPDGRP